MDIEKEREAFERYKFKDKYDKFKAYYDEHEREFGYRYPSYSNDDEWEIWLAAKAQSEKALLEQFEINAKLAEKIESMVTYDRLQQLIEIAVKATQEQKE